MTTASPGVCIRVFVLDDHEVVRQGVVSMIEDAPDMILAGESGSGEQALPALREANPDVIIADLRLPGMGGPTFIKKAAALVPAARFMVLTTWDSDEDIHQAFDAGAQAYLLKDSFVGEILATIRTVAAGGKVIPPALAQRLRARALGQGLSPREIEILAQVARGADNKAIATALGISPATVKTHLAHILEKLDAPDRTSAVTTAIVRGILRL